MSKTLRVFVLGVLACGLVVVAPPVGLTAPGTTAIQGVLEGSGGALTGSRAYRVRFYNAETAGSQLGGDLTGTVTVSASGRFSIELTPPSAALSADAVFYELAIDSAATPDGSVDVNDVFPNRVQVNAVLFTLGAWGLTGNSGTSSSSNSLGTTDNEGLTIVVNNASALRLEPASTPNLIGGNNANSVTAGAAGASIGGGGTLVEPNIVTDDHGTVAGGVNNRAGNAAGSFTDARWATVCGGTGNIASGMGSAVTGGGGNSATALASTVLGGTENHATGQYATVVGGLYNDAAGDYSFSAGRRAKANHQGSIILADSKNEDFSSTTNDQFRIRCYGGAHVVTGKTGSDDYGPWVAPGSGTWSAVSDRNIKENFEPIDARDVLERLMSLPISLWNYKAQDASIQHIGPVSQDFHAAFGVGPNERCITSVDADGVALAAIQGLCQIVQELGQSIELGERVVQERNDEVAELRVKNAELRERLANVEARMAAIEQAIAEPSGLLR